MSSFAESLSSSQRRGLRTRTYIATWFGGLSDLMLDNSALIIIYLTMLRAGNAVAMLSTGLTGIFNMLGTIPLTGLVVRFGHQRAILLSSIVGCVGCFITALAPIFGGGSNLVAVCGLIIFAVSKPIFNAAWLPVVNQILLPEERAGFFGFMRFSYNIVSGGVFFLLGLLMGKNPPLSLLQIAIAAIGALLLCRGLIIIALPLPKHVPQKYDIKGALAISVRNGPLVGFSVYTCFLMLAFAPVLPMAMLYMKKGLDIPADAVQMLSCSCIVGGITGYFFYGGIVKKIGVRAVQFATHGMFILVPLMLLFCGKTVPGVQYVVAFLLFVGNFAYACFFCAYSQESLALARPGNTTMATAFAATYMQLGLASGRSVASFMLGCGALATTWHMWGNTFTDFQAIFLFCAGLAIFCLTLIFCLPSVVPHHEDFYNP